MIINNLIKKKYISRPNRFTIEFENKDKTRELAHLHDPGRLKELLLPQTDVLIKYISNYKKTNRKTKYDVIAVKYNNNWVLLNSSYHNKLVQELIEIKKIPALEEYIIQQAEYTYGNSRLDFLLTNEQTNEKMFLEVKGCTLEINTLAKFPDAPTTRGKKHIDELIKIKKENKKASIIILVLQNIAKKFSPNYDTDPEFSKSLEEAYNIGVNIIPIHIITEYKKDKIILKANKKLDLIFKKEV